MPPKTPNTDTDYGKVVCIEQIKEGRSWRTRRVMTSIERTLDEFERTLEDYDFDWCKRDQTTFFEQSGRGPDNKGIYLHRLISPKGRIWLAPGYFCYDGGKSHSQDRISPDEIHLVFGYAVLSKYPGNPFVDAVEQTSHHCSICEDFLPVEDLCDHVWWCYTLGWYVGPGADEPSKPCKAPGCHGCRPRRSSKTKALA